MENTPSKPRFEGVFSMINTGSRRRDHNDHNVPKDD